MLAARFVLSLLIVIQIETVLGPVPFKDYANQVRSVRQPGVGRRCAGQFSQFSSSADGEGSSSSSTHAYGQL